MTTETQHSYESFQPGDKVRHPKFGEGTIMQRTGSGDRMKFVVTFAEEGEKYLMGAHAKLRKVQPIESKHEKAEAKPPVKKDEEEGEEQE